jgi:hypothetical protein
MLSKELRPGAAGRNGFRIGVGGGTTMNPRTKILAAVLALVVAVPAANAQGPAASYGRRPAQRFLSPTFGVPYVARRRPLSLRRLWVPGHLQRVQRRVWVEGEAVRRWTPPVFETRLDGCGRPVRVLVQGGCWTVAHQPGHFETRWVEIWIDGHWKTVP